MPIVSREALEACQIYFDPDPGNLPPQVEDLKTDLLDFSWSCFEDLDDLDHDLSPAWFRKRYPAPNEAKIWKDAKKSAGEARTLDAFRHGEPEWQAYYSQHFTRKFIETSAVKAGDDRRTIRSKLYYDHLESSFQRHWNLFNKEYGVPVNARQNLTRPNPDWAVGFPVYNEEYVSSIARHTGLSWYRAASAAVTMPFSEEVLQHLASHGLGSQMTRSLQDQGSSKEYNLCDHICFPWLVMEHKGCAEKGDPEDKVYRQLANATSAAVHMLRNLYKWSSNGVSASRGAGVIGISTVEKYVKVWITHCNGDRINMDCIWSGEVDKIVPTLQLQLILENIHSWANRVLRPSVSSQIEDWLSRYPMKRFDHLSTTLQERKYAIQYPRLNSLLRREHDVSDEPSEPTLPSHSSPVISLRVRRKSDNPRRRRSSKVPSSSGKSDSTLDSDSDNSRDSEESDSEDDDDESSRPASRGSTIPSSPPPREPPKHRKVPKTPR